MQSGWRVIKKTRERKNCKTVGRLVSRDETLVLKLGVLADVIDFI